jgi:16S rRNA (cytidine1402-2'-O)-methyltransferase
MDAALYLVGTPIGNLGDVSARALDTLRGAALVLAEDTRISRRLLERYEIRTPLMSCHRFSEASRADDIVARIAGGQAIALVTDSGMPCVSDPGARIVRAVRASGARVIVIPGPSAVPSALALSGYGSGGFSFAGFLPQKSGARARRLADLFTRDEPVVLFESPFRIHRLLDELAAAAPTRRVCICREMTKQFEETVEGPALQLRDALAARKGRGEYTVVIAPAGPDEPVPGTPVPDAGEPV